MQQTTTLTALSTSSLLAARWSIATATLVLGLLAALHLLSPEIDPSWRMVSEYALGSYGWILAILFLSWALSCASLYVAIRSQVQTVGGKIGLGFLLAAALGMGMSVIWDVSHNLHELSALIGMNSFPFAALLICISLIRNPAWTPARRVLLGTALLPWLGVVLMTSTIMIGVAQTGGDFGPGMVVGWANRILMVTYCVWLITVAVLALRLEVQERKTRIAQ